MLVKKLISILLEKLISRLEKKDPELEILVKEFINELEKIDSKLEVAIIDGFNGGGIPRTINFGPLIFDPSNKDSTFSGDERQDYSDIETKAGNEILVMGYGCY